MLRLLALIRLILFAIIGIIVLAFILPFTPDGTYVPETFRWEGGDGSVTLSCNEVMAYDGEITARIVFTTRDYAYVSNSQIIRYRLKFAPPFSGACGIYQEVPLPTA